MMRICHGKNMFGGVGCVAFRVYGGATGARKMGFASKAATVRSKAWLPLDEYWVIPLIYSILTQNRGKKYSRF